MSDWSGVRHVLAIRLDSLGDVLMTVPALRAVKEAGCEVTLLTSPGGAKLAPLIAPVDRTIAYAAPWMKASESSPVTADHAIIDELAQGRFDAAIVFTVFSQTPFPAAMLVRLAGIPRVLMHVRERAYALASDAVPEQEPEQGIRHEVQRQLDLVATLGWTPSHDRLLLSVPVGARARVAAWTSEGPWAVIHPGATAPSRRWPARAFAETVARLTGDHGWRVVLVGDASEFDLCAEIIAASGTAARNLAGQLDLPALAALIGCAPVLIGNNSGPAHIAAAMGTPVVSLYALTNPQHTPWRVEARVLNQDVPCRNCFGSTCRAGHHLCLRGVLPEEVVDAALDLTQPRRAVA